MRKITLSVGDRVKCNNWRELKKVYITYMANGGRTYRPRLNLYTDEQWEKYYGDYQIISYVSTNQLAGSCSDRNLLTMKEFLFRIGDGENDTIRGQTLKHYFV
jgi:hypothetical protein